jgi:YggT family protein
MSDLFNNAGLFFTQAIFSLYIFIVMLRILLQWVNIDFHNPLFAAIAKLTTPILKPLRHIISTIHGIDVAAVLLLLILEVIKIALLVWLQAGAMPNFNGLLILAFAELFDQLINIFFYAIIALAILSWVNPLAHSPLLEILFRLTEPIMRSVRQVIPTIGGIDISSIPVLIGLKALTVLVTQPLIAIGISLAMSG